MDRNLSLRPFLNPILIVAGLVAGLMVSSTAAASNFRTVALSGQQVPGTLGGANFGSFDRPVLNDTGQTAFYANLNGSGVTNSNNGSIWSEGSGTLALVAREGSQAAGLPNNVNYSAFGAPLLTNAGQTAFLSSTSGGGNGIWSERSGGLGVVAHTGNQLPDTPSGFTVGSFDSFVLNDAGQTALWCFLNPNDSGIWSEGTGSLMRVALSGTQAPGMPNGVNFGLPSFPVLNDRGQVAFAVPNQGIWSEGSGILALVGRSGSQAPGVPLGVNYWNFTSPVINNNGQSAFQARLIDSTGAPYGSGIWLETSGNVAPVAVTDTQSPGLPVGSVFFDLRMPVLNNSGQIAFYGRFSEFSAETNQGLWLASSGSVEPVAISGRQAPGVASGVVFGGLAGTNHFGSLVLNDAGQVAFEAGIRSNGVDDSNGGGIWATDRTGILKLIVRGGDLLEAAPGDFRTISGLSFFGNSGNSDGRPSGFNNLGQLAFRAMFTDGSQGIFVSSLVAIPEPGSLLLLSLGMWAALWHRIDARIACKK